MGEKYGIWVARPDLKSDEAIRWKTAANRALSSWMASGGRLFVTNQRIFYQPNRVDTILGRKAWDCPLDAVVAVDLVSRDRAILAGGMRERLGIQTPHGTEVFVVNHLKQKIEELRDLLAGA